MKLERMLIINDDTDDIITMQQQLPEDISVTRLTQFQATSNPIQAPVDLIILDNDANNLRASKGQETLKALRNQGVTTPIIYTSFQPGAIPGEVHQTRDVRVVRTDKAIEEIARQYNLSLRELPPRRKENEPHVNLIVTYNTVAGYAQGTYKQGELVIVSYNKHAGEGRAQQVVKDHMQTLYQQFDFREDRNILRNIFVYDGVNGEQLPGQLAIGLGHDARMKAYVLACDCDWERKQRLQRTTYTELFPVECGGQDSLGKIVDVILGIKRPGVDYNRLPMPVDKITGIAEKFDI
jgi:CheY-like chemotaxis protein